MSKSRSPEAQKARSMGDSIDNNRLQQVSTEINTSAPKTDQSICGIPLKLSENKCF